MRVALATLLTLLLAAMLFSCDVDNTPVEVEEDSPAADAAPSLDRLISSAEIVDTKALGGIEMKLGKVDSLLPAPFAKIDLFSQFVGPDGNTPGGVFAPGDPFCMTLWFYAKEAGSMKCLFMWLGVSPPVRVFPDDNPWDLWWEFSIPGPGMYYVALYLGGGAPNAPGVWQFLGAVSYDPSFGLPSRRDWGFVMPSPRTFIITSP